MDHLTHLVIEEAMGSPDMRPMRYVLEKLSALTKYFMESHLSLEALLETQADLEIFPYLLSIVL